jgi:AcrR family transcriptional regulator
MTSMTKNTTDRRIQRTSEMLQHALISLILKKGYEAITVSDICEAANVGRSTFYAHYTSKDDLKRKGLKTLRRLLVERQRDALAMTGDVRQRSLSFSLPMFEHARDHIGLYRALVSSGGSSVALGSIREMLSDLVRHELTVTTDSTSVEVPRELVVQYVVGAYMNVLIWWLDGGAKLPPQQMDAMFRRLATEGIMS